MWPEGSRFCSREQNRKRVSKGPKSNRAGGAYWYPVISSLCQEEVPGTIIKSLLQGVRSSLFSCRILLFLDCYSYALSLVLFSFLVLALGCTLHLNCHVPKSASDPSYGFSAFLITNPAAFESDSPSTPPCPTTRFGTLSLYLSRSLDTNSWVGS